MSQFTFTVGRTPVILVDSFQAQVQTYIRSELSCHLRYPLIYIIGFELTRDISKFIERLSTRGTVGVRFNVIHVPKAEPLSELAARLRDQRCVIIAPLKAFWFFRAFQAFGETSVQVEEDEAFTTLRSLVTAAFELRFGPPENTQLNQRFRRLMLEAILAARELAAGNEASATALEKIERSLAEMRKNLTAKMYPMFRNRAGT